MGLKRVKKNSLLVFELFCLLPNSQQTIFLLFYLKTDREQKKSSANLLKLCHAVILKFINIAKGSNKTLKSS